MQNRFTEGSLTIRAGWDGQQAWWKRVGNIVFLFGSIRSTYGVNPAAGDPLFDLPVNAAKAENMTCMTNQSWHQVSILASAGSKTVKLVAGESGDWPTGTEIYLSGQYVAV
ncbi:hypothetical protein EMO89_02780 [Bifidobacterium tissieri]|uniref:Uncharacterized protein n=1 Tax=Bifidobacterium tissieri TaxID=1630162 RepID=A0A5M9ZVX1_9BIFI|nr:hypothetical protein [Bifidobacterium tissieri]KAA8831665.1 hypothetical protein EMO89_02780 [Bifidobacterium tissieri]